MAAFNSADKLIVIVGPTASGKSALAMELAQSYGGEIICADSRTVYKGMDIGTAKPTAEEQRRVRHFGLDIVAPGERFTAADFKTLAFNAMDDIYNRRKLPFMVGGTGLYIDSVIYDFQFLPAVPTIEREKYSAMSIEQLQSLLDKRGIELPANSRNPRHLIRALETNGYKAKHAKLRENTLVLGLDMPKDVLEQRLKNRTDKMFADGLLGEVRDLAKKYGWENEAMTGVGYRECRALLEGSQTEQQTKELITTHSLQYAKRQMTWFKRHSEIHWITSVNEAKKLVEHLQKTASEHI